MTSVDIRPRGARARTALERRLLAWRALPQPTTPPVAGWVRAVREALGMTTSDLASRMNVSQPSVTRLEQSEQAMTVQLATLARAAEAMECDLVYALVPRRPLDEIVSDQAARKATDQLRRLDHTMALEQQAVDDERLRQNFELLRAQVLNGRGLWHQTKPADPEQKHRGRGR